MPELSLFELPGPIKTVYEEEVTFVRLLRCHRCFSSRLYKPQNSKEQDVDYAQAHIFMLYCQNCLTFQNHDGEEDSYKALSEMRVNYGRRYHGW